MSRLLTLPLAVALLLAVQVVGRAETPLQFIKVAEVQRLGLQGRQLLLVDVRTPQEYQARRIKGAISMPLSSLEARYAELPRQGLLVLY